MSPTPPKPTVGSALNFVVTRFVSAAHNPLISYPTVGPKKRAATAFQQARVHACPFLINQINQSSALFDLLEARLITLSEKKFKLTNVQTGSTLGGTIANTLEIHLMACSSISNTPFILGDIQAFNTRSMMV